MSQNSPYAASGRILIAILFLLSGIGKIGAPEATQGYIASVGLPFPMLAYLLAVVTEVGGGILLIVGYRARIVSLILAVFTAVTALFFPSQLRRPEPDDSLPEELRHLRRPPSDCGIRSGRAES